MPTPGVTPVILGWVLTKNPAARLSEVRSQCAKILAGELDASQLVAEMRFDECLGFWRQTVLIQQVRHFGEDMLLFVHKTLGEYAGARYLAGLPAGMREAGRRAPSATSVDRKDIGGPGCERAAASRIGRSWRVPTSSRAAGGSWNPRTAGAR